MRSSADSKWLPSTTKSVFQSNVTEVSVRVSDSPPPTWQPLHRGISGATLQITILKIIKNRWRCHEASTKLFRGASARSGKSAPKVELSSAHPSAARLSASASSSSSAGKAVLLPSTRILDNNRGLALPRWEATEAPRATPPTPEPFPKVRSGDTG